MYTLPRFDRFIFKTVAEDNLKMPLFKGAMLRGALGTAFKRAVCVRRALADCGPCDTEKCPYRECFESRDAEGRTVPRPFVIEPPEDLRTTVAQGETFEFGLVLFGRGLDLLPCFVMLFDEVGRRGVGYGAGRFRLSEVISESDGSVVYREGETFRREQGIAVEDFRVPQEMRGFRIKFITPTQIRVKGVSLDVPSFGDVIRTLMRRMKLLYRFHSSSRVSEEKVREVIDLSGTLRMKRVTLVSSEISRFSRRQGQRIRHPGFTGYMDLAGYAPALLPWLMMGEYLHVGKGCTFGMGRYIIDIR